MGAEALSNRDNWQMGARITGDYGENQFVERLAEVLSDHYEIILKPPKIPIFSNGKGIEPDAQIINHETGKCLFVEMKTGNRGGNATEERAAKYLSRGINRRVKELHDTPPNPFIIIFFGDIFNGRDGQQGSFIIERQQKNSGKIIKTTVHPKMYREKVHVMFEGVPYAIMDENFTNIEDVATQIMEIL